MTQPEIPLRRPIVTGGFVLAVSALAIALFAAAPATLQTPTAACPAGQHLDSATGRCEPNAPGAPTAGEFGSIPGNPSIPTVDGIPCTGANTGECIGLQQSDAGQADTVPPSSTVGDGDESVRPAS